MCVPLMAGSLRATKIHDQWPLNWWPFQMTWSYRVINEPGMRSWAWMVLGPGGTVGSSRDATSHVGGAVRCRAEPRRGGDLLQLGVGEQRWAARLERLDHAADRHGRGEQVAVDRRQL